MYIRAVLRGTCASADARIQSDDFANTNISESNVKCSKGVWQREVEIGSKHF